MNTGLRFIFGFFPPTINVSFCLGLELKYSCPKRHAGDVELYERVKRTVSLKTRFGCNGEFLVDLVLIFTMISITTDQIVVIGRQSLLFVCVVSKIMF